MKTRTKIFLIVGICAVLAAIPLAIQQSLCSTLHDGFCLDGLLGIQIVFELIVLGIVLLFMAVYFFIDRAHPTGYRVTKSALSAISIVITLILLVLSSYTLIWSLQMRAANKQRALEIRREQDKKCADFKAGLLDTRPLGCL